VAEIIRNGKQSDREGYDRFLRAVAEHYDKFTTIRSGYAEDKRQKRGTIPLKEFEKAIASTPIPSGDWVFILNTDDEDFAVWFRMKYF
jgi:hypothetical protein